MIEHPGSGSIETAVEDAAARLRVPVDEIWRLINTGELSCEETADGLWIIPEWSVDYLLKDRAGALGTSTGPSEPIVPPPAPLPEKKKTKKRDPAKKWKQRFDAMGKDKNELTKQVRASWQLKDDPQSKKRTLELQGLLDEAKRELVQHVKAGVEAGFIDPPEQRPGRKKARAGRAAASTPKLDLEKLGLQVGLSFSKEREILNAFDPRRQLEAWEKPTAARGGSYQRPDR